jgi:uncharacterized membrane protein YeaQ/YmgE (transglycosylase-associated protein family)
VGTGSLSQKTRQNKKPALWTGKVFHLELGPSGLSAGVFSMGIIAALVIGAIAGWLAGLIVRGAGFGLIGNIVVGIIGALVASWLLPQLHVELATGTLGAILDATVGAVIILVILSLVRRA